MLCWSRTPTLSDDELLGAFRAWLVHHDAHTDFTTEDGTPVWVPLVCWGAWTCVQELLDAASPDKMLIDHRDKQGRGWLHYAIYNAMPDTLATEGLLRAGQNWDAPDHHGNTPFMALPSVGLAHAMAGRWWREHIPYTSQNGSFFALLRQHALRAQRKDLARIWHFWARG